MTFPNTMGAFVGSSVVAELNSQKPPPDAVSRVPVSRPVIETPCNTAGWSLSLTRWSRHVVGSIAVRQLPSVVSTATVAQGILASVPAEPPVSTGPAGTFELQPLQRLSLIHI